MHDGASRRRPGGSNGSIGWFRDPVVMRSVGRDVTDRHLAQLQARESEQRVRLAMDRAPIGMEIVGLDDRLMEVNDAL